jgi:hypothetical protein
MISPSRPLPCRVALRVLERDRSAGRVLRGSGPAPARSRRQPADQPDPARHGDDPAAQPHRRPGPLRPEGGSRQDLDAASAGAASPECLCSTVLQGHDHAGHRSRRSHDRDRRPAGARGRGDSPQRAARGLGLNTGGRALRRRDSHVQRGARKEPGPRSLLRHRRRCSTSLRVCSTAGPASLCAGRRAQRRRARRRHRLAADRPLAPARGRGRPDRAPGAGGRWVGVERRRPCDASARTCGARRARSGTPGWVA